MLDEPPSADPHARWCGEGGLETRPYPIRDMLVLLFSQCEKYLEINIYSQP